jgi:hypothetical protein
MELLRREDSIIACFTQSKSFWQDEMAQEEFTRRSVETRRKLDSETGTNPPHQ